MKIEKRQRPGSEQEELPKTLDARAIVSCW